MFIPWDSLKVRLAVATAFLMSVGVAVTVIHAVSELQGRATQSVIDTNLGAGQIARGLSVSVTERQRALVAAARAWRPELAASGARADAFLAGQSVLHVLFDRVLVTDGGESFGAAPDVPVVVAPVRDLAAAGALDIVFGSPVRTAGGPAPLLVGTLSMRSANFLSNAVRIESLGKAELQTIVANQQGLILADSNPAALLGRVDDDPRLRARVAQWRVQGSPLEPEPWTGRVGDYFIAMAAVPGTDWMLFRVAPAEALFGRASQSILSTTALGVTVGLTGAVAIFAVTTWLLLPMTRLKTRALLALDPDQPADKGWPSTGGEVGQLSEVLRHVSEQLAASRSKMEQALRRMAGVLEHAPAGIAFTTEGRFELVSRAFERMLGYGRGELDGGFWERLMPPSQTDESLRDAARQASAEGRSVEMELQLRRRDGSLLWTHVHCAVLQGHDAVPHTIWLVVDSTDAKRQREYLEWTAAHDPLTDLANRREFEHQLSNLLNERRRHGPSSALFIDLDHFKQVNDSAGHGAGDALLKRIARSLKDRMREEDTVARLGGDEFSVLLRGCSLDQAMQVAEQIRAEVQACGKVEGASLGVTASIGVVEIADAHGTLAAVLEAADQACYAAKRDGRNRVRAAASEQTAVPAGS